MLAKIKEKEAQLIFLFCLSVGIIYPFLLFYKGMLFDWFDPKGVLLFFVGVILVVCLLYFMQRRYDSRLFCVLAFGVLFYFYVARALYDIVLPYMYMEDGMVMLERSVTLGWAGVFTVDNGTFWVLQKIIGRISLFIVNIFGAFWAMPYVMGILSKLVGVGGIAYFMSDRFAWLIKERIWRFLICVLVILVIPVNGADVIACDTSMPFVLLFTVFLIALRLFCGEKIELPTWAESCFLMLVAISSAGAPVIMSIVFCAFFGWLFFEIKDGVFDKKRTMIALLKTVLIMAVAFIQVWTVVTSDRAQIDWDMSTRINFNTRLFVFFPYWQVFGPWLLFGIGLLGWIGIFVFAKVHWKVMGFCGIYSWLFMLYCSLTYSNMEECYKGLMVARYLFCNMAIAVLIWGMAIYAFWQKEGIARAGSGILAASLLLIAAVTFFVPFEGGERIVPFMQTAKYFDKKGMDTIWVMHPPMTPWKLAFKADISGEEKANDMKLTLKKVDGMLPEKTEKDAKEVFGAGDPVSFSASVKDAKITTLLYDLGGGHYWSCCSTDQSEDYARTKKWQEGETDWFTFEIGESYLPTSVAVYFDPQKAEGVSFVGQDENGEWHKGRYVFK